MMFKWKTYYRNKRLNYKNKLQNHMFWSVILLNGKSTTFISLPKCHELIQFNDAKFLFCFVLPFCTEKDQWTPKNPQTGGSRCVSDYSPIITTSDKCLWKHMGTAVESQTGGWPLFLAVWYTMYDREAPVQCVIHLLAVVMWWATTSASLFQQSVIQLVICSLNSLRAAGSN